MKFATLLIAAVAAQDGEVVEYGAECSDDVPCEGSLTCVLAVDGVTGYCQDCSLPAREWTDMEEFVCPEDGMEDSSSTLILSTAAVLAAASMMA